MKKLKFVPRAHSSASVTGPARRAGRQKGFTLLEALIAFVVLAGGLLALFRYHATTVEGTGTAKVRAEAIALGEQKLEELRSYLTKADFDADTATGAGLGDYSSGVDYAENFTRQWTVSDNGVNRKEIAVIVSWTDSANDPQQVQVSSLVLGTPPTQAASRFAGVIAVRTGGVPVWPQPNPLDNGTGYGTGEVTVTLKGSDNNDYLEGDVLPDGVTIVSYSISFTGYIDATNALLESVTLTGDAGTTGVPSCSGAMGNPNDPAVLFIADGVTAYGVSTTVYDIGTWLDEFGEPLPPGTDPYRYTCTITGIDHNEVWTGTIVYVGVGNDEVCIPNTGSAELAFSEQSPAILDLGIVILTNQGACKVL